MFRSFTLTTITWFALSGLFPVTAAGAPLEPQTSSSKIDLRFRAPMRSSDSR